MDLVITLFILIHCIAARYTSNNGEFQASATKLSYALVNVRAILTHFSPKIDEFLTSQNISTPTEDQVSSLESIIWMLDVSFGFFPVCILECVIRKSRIIY
jgi:hypothetical protein